MLLFILWDQGVSGNLSTAWGKITSGFETAIFEFRLPVIPQSIYSISIELAGLNSKGAPLEFRCHLIYCARYMDIRFDGGHHLFKTSGYIREHFQCRQCNVGSRKWEDSFWNFGPRWNRTRDNLGVNFTPTLIGTYLKEFNKVWVLNHRLLKVSSTFYNITPFFFPRSNSIDLVKRSRWQFNMLCYKFLFKVLMMYTLTSQTFTWWLRVV